MKTKTIISLSVNILIFGLVVMSTVFMMTGYRFMGDDLILTANKIEAFKFFTVDSNILVGVIALLFAVYEILLLSGKIAALPKFLYVLKHTATVGVVLTFLTTACFLAPFLVDDYWILFKNSNLFFHAVIPILSAIVWIFTEDTDKLRFRDTFIGVIPMAIYAVFYCANAFAHVVDGKVPMEYDWYGFVQGGIVYALVALPLMLVATYFISFLLCICNKSVHKLYSKKVD